MHDRLPAWLVEWLGLIVPVAQVVLVVLVAWLLQRLVHRIVLRVNARYELPVELAVGTRRVLGFVIYAAASMLILERLGVSGTVLWTAFTGFAAVAAVAFFAAWSVLSNIFCTILIFTTRPFRLFDHVELLENGEKPGLRGRVVDINLVYTTLHETGAEGAGTILLVPNNLFFQRTVRRWRGPPPALPRLPGAQADRIDTRVAAVRGGALDLDD
ncbi:mechanosensitive ion channel family protein [Luteimonas yindakuii]|uniref:Small-conductance mechanosensitive channel n=1 Tax=Luteimonas yindakuii TaxID=2565782 RepID=A0A4Z1R2J3_9GAMM|nr:mechanosensitive ion channel family protein [Luteimonas yindakuii]QCU72539.1 mechanosensitive ion channel family protein [Luteimonas yindakuii]TKS53874.1 mechanosensitive ion channel family protein [Luteimonas yindakuii]